MKVSQVKDILSGITAEILGESVVINEDLSNVVDIGKSIENAENGLDNYVRKLPDHIGRVITVDRIKPSRAPNIMRDGWEYGAIMEKIRIDNYTFAKDFRRDTRKNVFNLRNFHDYLPPIR